jgi:hypothetical protein
MLNHTAKHERAALCILGYLAKHTEWGIGFTVNSNPGGPVSVEIHADSSWVDVKPECFSSYGYNTFLCGSVVVWQCKHTLAVCTLSTEAEYNAYAEGSKECCFMHNF